MSTAKQIGNREAFPSSCAEGPVAYGMSYREWLIGMAMQGMLASANYDFDGMDDAIKNADAILAALAKETDAK